MSQIIFACDRRQAPQIFMISAVTDIGNSNQRSKQTLVIRYIGSEGWSDRFGFKSGGHQYLNRKNAQRRSAIIGAFF